MNLTVERLRMRPFEGKRRDGAFLQLVISVWCLAYIVGCAATHSPTIALRSERYPQFFQQPTRGNLGVGFATHYPRSIDISISRAHERALRLLAWSEKVRVTGERQFEQTAGGMLEFRGESIELLEIDLMDGEACFFDSVFSGSRVWIQAARKPHVPGLGELTELPREPPPWIAHPPPDGDMIYALGTASIAHRDEPGSWEVASYNALVEIAFKARSRLRSLEVLEGETATGVHVLQVDTLLRGFRVIARWKDRHNIYVLAGVPRNGVTSMMD